MRYRCHECFCVIDFEDIAHRDIYSDLCWIQCRSCAEAFGEHCGVDRKANPHPHGYLGCRLWVEPLRPRQKQRPVTLHVVGDLETT